MWLHLHQFLWYVFNFGIVSVHAISEIENESCAIS
jgi:hypothetical protein